VGEVREVDAGRGVANPFGVLRRTGSVRRCRRRGRIRVIRVRRPDGGHLRLVNLGGERWRRCVPLLALADTTGDLGQRLLVSARRRPLLRHGRIGGHRRRSRLGPHLLDEE